MNFTNINDPASVKALLDQLRSSPAWQETLLPPTDPSSLANRNPEAAIQSRSSPSVATLLSQLQSSPTWRDDAPLPTPAESPRIKSALSSADPPPPPPPPPHQDIKSYTFQQALPHLARFSEDPNLVRLITQIKQQQADLEQQLWEQRQSILKKYEERVKVTQTKATLIGTSLTKHEADKLSCAFQTELQKFDIERVLPAWDGLVIKQQAALEGSGVPTMFTTIMPKDRERQQRVIQVLEGITG